MIYKNVDMADKNVHLITVYLFKLILSAILK